MRQLVVLASGNGGNFEALATACQTGAIPDARVVMMICDRPGAYVLERASRLGVPGVLLDPRTFPSRSAHEDAIIETLSGIRVDLVCLAGYMRILGERFVDMFEGRMINIHPALLPAFKGNGALKASFEYGVKVFGPTIHYVSNELDSGRIVAQRAFEYDGDSLDELSEKMHATEHALYIETVRRLLDERRD